MLHELLEKIMKPYFQQGGVTMYHGDCLEIMPELKPPFDAIIADLPQKITNADWDVIIPFEPLWSNYKRLIKKNGAIALFGNQPFTSMLVLSNLSYYRYNLIWDKVNKFTDCLNSNKRPMRDYEDIAIFYKKQPAYNEQKRGGSYTTRHTTGNRNTSTVGDVNIMKNVGNHVNGLKPGRIIRVKAQHNTSSKMIHPTQKPVELIRRLIRTYTNRGDIILDNTAGSFTTGVACILEGRRFVGIEKELEYCEAGRERMIEALFEAGKTPETTAAERPGYQMGFNLE